MKVVSLGLMLLMLTGCPEDKEVVDCKCPEGQRWMDNECQTVFNIMGCIQVYEPVCGCDNKTYSNSCEANVAGVKTFEQGECK